ncbi:MAG: hypothetical protein KJO07_16670 [Deltaproteobacteria bacterium]|nr:hypothetical protein [Deltaproteobacteria bacterium]
MTSKTTLAAFALVLACGGTERPGPATALSSELVVETLAASSGSSASAAAIAGQRAYLAGSYHGELKPAGATGRGAFVHRIPAAKGWPRTWSAGSGQTVHVSAIDAAGETVAVALSRSSTGRPPRSTVVGLGSDGAQRWELELTTRVGFATVSDLAVAEDGTVYAVGSFTGVLELAGSTLRGDGISDGFIAAIGSDGTARWAQRFGGAGGDQATAVAYDPAVGVVVSGWFSGEAAVQRATLASNDDSVDGLLLRMRADGALIWARQLGGAGTDTLIGVAARGDQIAVVGTFERSLLAGTQPIQSAGSSDILVAVMSREAEPRWMQRLGGAGPDIAAGVALLGNGRLVVAGQVGVPSRIGSTTVDGSFYAVAPAGPEPTGWTLSPVEGNVTITDVAADGRPVVAVTARGTVSLPGATITGSEAGTAAAIVPAATP